MSEAELYKTKFWDYRLMTQTDATLLFIKDYLHELAYYNERMGENLYQSALLEKQMFTSDPICWKHWKQMNRLRRFADEHGMKYREFWELMFEGFTELRMKTVATKRGIIVPVSKFTNKRLLEWVVEKFPARFGNTVRYAGIDFYKPERYESHPLQREYYDYVLKKQRNLSSEKILRLLEDGKLSEAFLREQYTLIA